MLTAAGAEALRVPACQRLKKFAPFRPGKARCITVRAVHAPSADETVSRRQALQGLAVLVGSVLAPLQASAAGKSAEVGRQVRAPLSLSHRIPAENPFELSAAICRLRVHLVFQTSSQTSPKLQ